MKALAVLFGVHPHTISACLHHFGIPLRDQGVPVDKIDEAAALYHAGWSLQRLADRYGCSVNNVRKRLIAHGVTMRPRPGWPK